MTSLITGATGFVGKHILARLEGSVITSRDCTRAESELGDRISRAISWDPIKQYLQLRPEDDFSAVINLMGETIAEGRWTKVKKQRIRDSRVVGTKKLVDAALPLK